MARDKRPYGLQYREAVKHLAILRGAKGSKLNVLDVLLSHCNGDTGQAWPGNKIIKRNANIRSDDTRHKALKWLRDAGIIHAVSHESGGKNCAVCWGFGLPAWSTRETLNTCPKNGQDSPVDNLSEKSAKPVQFSGDTCPKNGQPTKRTERTEEKVPTGRRQDEPTRPETAEEQALWDATLSGGTYGDAVYQLRRWREQQGAHVP